MRSLKLFCILIVSGFGVSAQSAEAITQKLDEYFKNERKEWSIPGMAVAVIKDGEVLLAKGYGFRKIEEC